MVVVVQLLWRVDPCGRHKLGGRAVGRDDDAGVVLRFGAPAIVAAVGGALLLRGLAGIEPLLTWQLGARTCEITPVKLVIAALITLFAMLDLLERFQSIELPLRLLPVGGMLSGFFGGLSGHQGALRSAFLVRAGLSRDGFVGTAAVCSALVDFTRIGVYAIAALLTGGSIGRLEDGLPSLVAVACVAAFTGTFLGKRLVRKVTLRTVQRLVAVLLVLLALALGSGII